MSPNTLSHLMSFKIWIFYMSVQRLHVETRFCEVAMHGNLVHLAGQLASDTQLDITGQTAQTLAHIDRLLADAGTHKRHILSVMIFLKDIEKDYAAMNAVWDQWVEAGHPPARTCVESKLYAPDVLVEMTVVAVKPSADVSVCAHQTSMQ